MLVELGMLVGLLDGSKDSIVSITHSCEPWLSLFFNQQQLAVEQMIFFSGCLMHSVMKVLQTAA